MSFEILGNLRTLLTFGFLCVQIHPGVWRGGGRLSAAARPVQNKGRGLYFTQNSFFSNPSILHIFLYFIKI